MSNDGLSQAQRIADQSKVFGHPSGLYTLFFAEMWERFSYYGMRALLVFYMIKGFLGYGDDQAYSVYGFYTSLVYMTPFIGGLLADKILGKRIAVVIGGILMAAGHLLMTVESEWPFFIALALLITGNGFFKPNISTMVGALYRDGDKTRDDGFNIFYTGINLGAAISPLLCGYVGEVYGWHYGFGLATIGMLVGLAVFIMPNALTSVLIGLAALATAAGLFVFHADNFWATCINIFVAICLLISAVAACMALSKGGLPDWAGGRPEGQDSRHDWKVYLGIVIVIPIFTLLVSGFSPLMSPTDKQVKAIKSKEKITKERVEFLDKLGVEKATIDKIAALEVTPEKPHAAPYQLISKSVIDQVNGDPKGRIYQAIAEILGKEVDDVDGKEDLSKLSDSQKEELKSKLSDSLGIDLSSIEDKNMTDGKSIIKETAPMLSSFFGDIAGIFVKEVSQPAGLVLTVLGILAFGYLIIETFKLDTISFHRMIAALVLIFFQMLFFAFFEQAGSSINNFTDRNIDRVSESKVVTKDMVGQTVTLEATQAQLGYQREGTVFTLDNLELLRKLAKEAKDIDSIPIQWKIDESNIGMAIAEQKDELPASVFQSFNAIFILLFALVFNWIWSTLRKMNLDPSAPVKFGLGLVQLGLGFYVFYIGAQNNNVGMVSVFWLSLGILLHTTGELCLSPVGLSTMTKLSPKHLVSTLMGAWFLATAFSQYLAGVISKFTSVDGASDGFPPPSETVNVYGNVFRNIGYVAMICGAVCLLISPLLSYLMHQDKMGDSSEKQPTDE